MVIYIFEKFEHTFDIKSIDKEKRIIRGIASLEEVDRDNEIIAMEAIKYSLQNWLINPVIKYNHQNPIGKAIPQDTFINEEEKAFIVTAYISDATQTAKDTWGLIQDGIIKSFSVGGKVLEKEVIKQNGRESYKITKMELYEVSVVDIPSNKKSFFEVIAKSIKENKEFVCPYCNEKFNSEEKLLEHKSKCPKKEANQDVNKPGPGHVHSDKWHRCVQHLREQGGVDSPEAVCTAQLGEESFNRSVNELTLEEIKEIDSFVKKLKSYFSFLSDNKLGDMEHMTDESKNKKEVGQCNKKSNKKNLKAKLKINLLKKLQKR